MPSADTTSAPNTDPGPETAAISSDHISERASIASSVGVGERSEDRSDASDNELSESESVEGFIADSDDLGIRSPDVGGNVQSGSTSFEAYRKVVRAAAKRPNAFPPLKDLGVGLLGLVDMMETTSKDQDNLEHKISAMASILRSHANHSEIPMPSIKRKKIDISAVNADNELVQAAGGLPVRRKRLNLRHESPQRTGEGVNHERPEAATQSRSPDLLPTQSPSFVEKAAVSEIAGAPAEESHVFIDRDVAMRDRKGFCCAIQ